MIKRIGLFFLFYLTATVVTPLWSQSSYELVWSDEFNSNGFPDSTSWSYETGAGGWGNNELEYYTSKRLDNARVENGSLILEARKESYSGSNYTSARLMTYHNGKYWKYGRIEARMKLPYGQGIWPAFWMMGKSLFAGTGWPACGEIDIMELIGGGEGRDDKVYGTAHWANAAGSHAQYGGNYQLAQGIFADTFHIFSIEWTETYIKWFVDGIQFNVISITPSDLSEFHQEFFLILNLAVGGNWPGYPDSTTVFPQKLEVDYIRVFQMNTTAIEPKRDDNSLIVYPSPATDKLFVKNLKKKQKYFFFDCLGKMVRTGVISPGSYIKLNGLNPGIYIIQFPEQYIPRQIKFVKTA